jgi:hypothetical protein
MQDYPPDVLLHLCTLLEELSEETGIPFQKDMEESEYQVEEVQEHLQWSQINTTSLNTEAHDKFVTKLETLLEITGREQLDILKRGPGLVSVTDLLDKASGYFTGDEVLEGVVVEIYKSIKAYYKEEKIQVSKIHIYILSKYACVTGGFTSQAILGDLIQALLIHTLYI